jgi:hypothetical protein
LIAFFLHKAGNASELVKIWNLSAQMADQAAAAGVPADPTRNKLAKLICIKGTN